MTATAIDPARPEQVAPALLTYLRATLAIPAPAYAEAPVGLGEGWETYIYGFRLAGDGLEAAWARPLVLRVFPTADLGRRAEEEAAVQRFVCEHGFLAPRPLVVEASGTALGLPFMVMERVAGVTLLDRLSANPLGSRHLIPRMAELHATLHRLPVDGWPLPGKGSLVARRLEDFRARAG